MTSHDNVTDIVERLMESCPHPRTGAPLFVNPDGPAVVAIIEAQQADLATLRKQLENAREALRFYANLPRNLEFGHNISWNRALK